MATRSNYLFQTHPLVINEDLPALPIEVRSPGFYLPPEELRQVLEVAYNQAINKASLEVAEGLYEVRELEQLVNKEEILNLALTLILSPE